MSTHPPIPARQRRKEARPQELLDAALALFSEKGFSATRSEEVAAAAGVSKGTLYLYYPSKEELLKAVIRERVSTEIQSGVDEVLAFTGSNAQVLRQVLPRWWLRIFESPASAVFKLIVTEVRNFPDIAAYYGEQVVEPGSQLVGGVVQRGIDAGEFRPVDVESTVHSLILPMVMLCMHKHSLGACSTVPSLMFPRDFIFQHMDTVTRGIELHTKPGLS